MSKELKLNLTRDTVIATLAVSNEAVRNNPALIGKMTASSAIEFCNDWLTYADNDKAQSELIEQLEKALKEASLQIKAKAKHPRVYEPNYYYLDEVVDTALSCVESWRAGKEQK